MSKVLDKLILRQMTPHLRKILDHRIAAYDMGIAARMCYYDWSRTGSGRLKIASMSELC